MERRIGSSHRITTWIAALALTLGYAALLAAPAAAGSDFEDSFERELGRVAARATVGAIFGLHGFRPHPDVYFPVVRLYYRSGYRAHPHHGTAGHHRHGGHWFRDGGCGHSSRAHRAPRSRHGHRDSRHGSGGERWYADRSNSHGAHDARGPRRGGRRIRY